jgi:hypothetical protein
MEGKEGNTSAEKEGNTPFQDRDRKGSISTPVGAVVIWLSPGPESYQGELTCTRW